MAATGRGPGAPLPPLVPDSPTARLLYDIWTGRRLVSLRSRDLGGSPGSALAVVLAHLHRRAGFDALVIGGRRYVASCRTPLALLLPEDSIATAGPPSQYRHRGITFMVPDEHTDVLPEGLFDLVVMLTGAMASSAGHLHAALLASRQLLVLDDLTGRLHLEDQAGVNMPLDVALAGGVGP